MCPLISDRDHSCFNSKWEPGDEKWSPRCQEKCLKDSAVDPAMTTASALSETGGAGNTGASPLVCSQEKVATLDYKSPAAQAVQEAGNIPEHLVQLAIGAHFLETGKSFTNVQQLYLAAEEIAKSPEMQASLTRKVHLAELKAAEEKKQLAVSVVEDGAEVKGHADSLHEEELASESETAMANSHTDEEDETKTAAYKAKMMEHVRALTREKQKLERRKRCRKCRKVELSANGVTFLPCGHFLVCEECAESLDDCLACGKSIMGTVRTFLA